MSILRILGYVPISNPEAGSVYLYVNSSNELETRDDAGNIRTPIVGVTSEEVQDIIGNALVDSSTVNVTYNDASNQITFDVIQSGISHTSISNIGSNTHTQIDSHISSISNPHSVTKTQLGLSNVDNTSDVNKPVSTATQTALNLKINSNLIGAANGVAGLDAAQKIALANIPVLIDHTTLNNIGSNSHTQIDSHISSTSNPHSVTKAQVGLSNVDNTSDASKPISTATQTALDAKENTGVAAGLVSTHEGLSDPHSQYITTAEGDAAYAPIAHVGSGGASHVNATTSVAGFMSSADKTKLDGVTNDVFYETTAAVNNSSGTILVDITELSFPVVTGKAYRINSQIIYQTVSTGIGIEIAIGGSGGAAGTLTVLALTNTSTTASQSRYLRSLGTTADFGSTAYQNENILLKLEGVFICTTSGNLTPQFRSETNGSNIRIQPNSIMEVKEF
jgi:hypothetical protein